MHATLEEVAEMVGGQLVMGEGRQPIDAVTTDSRNVAPNSLFVPLLGPRFDGHQFAQQALLAGAVAVLWDRSLPLPFTPPALIQVEDALAALGRLAKAWLARVGATVVGITGSNGKTTTKELAAAALSTRYRVARTQGNYNNVIGLPLTVLQMEPGTQIAVLEMGMNHAGEIRALTAIAAPHVAVITLIGEAHIENLGSREAIAAAKAEILERMGSADIALLNGDEPLLLPYAKRFPGTVRTFGKGETCDYRLVRLLTGDWERTYFLGWSRTSGEHAFELAFGGRHNAINALAAWGVAESFGIDAREVAEAFAQVRLPDGRLQRRVLADGSTLIDDTYNASPTSTLAALEMVADTTSSQHKGLLLGEMRELGQQASLYHRQVAQRAAQVADRIVFVGPLFEEAWQDCQRHGPSSVRFCWYLDIAAALDDHVERWFSDCSLILAKGSHAVGLSAAVKAIIGARGGLR
ncbi:MAG: UDP-N-acetylmuramoyl-tripeptide--D-alanyl-D-alanine ligase [Firmicutes bacterium]|nr:UDP-N-acetylmuramoyl-tripeptide--D-alanyl-D-alanine ligase [Bacillota bacterium]